MMNLKEIEVRFLDIDKNNLIENLHNLGAQDKHEDFIREIIFYDKEGTWIDQHKFARIRRSNKGIIMTYKHQESMTIDGTIEIEITIDNEEKGKALFEALGLVAFRIQEKKRHTFIYKNVTVDIDTWPLIPTYVELEGNSEDEIKQVAQDLKFDWSKAVFENAKIVIEKYYHVPVSSYTHFTFEKSE